MLTAFSFVWKFMPLDVWAAFLLHHAEVGRPIVDVTRRYHSLRIARPRTHPFPPTLGPLAPTRTSARAGPGLTQGQILLLGNEGSFEHLYLLSLQSFEGVLRI